MCKKDGWCSCCCNWSMKVAIFGLAISAIFLVLAAVINFHTFGFVVACIGMIASGGYIWFIMKDKRSASDYQDLPADDEAKTKTHSVWSKILWVLFVILVTGVIPPLAFARLMALWRRKHWRMDQNKFPSACGSWAEANGCTRITLDEAGCVRPIDILTENQIIFKVANS